MTSPSPTPRARRMRRARAFSRALAGVGALLVGAVALQGLAVPASAAAPGPPRPGVAFASAPEAPARYVKQISCDPVERPGTKALRQLLLTTYGRANSGGITRSCSVGGASEHKDGRAYDWANQVSVPSQKADADAFVGWLTSPDAQGVAAGNARRLGVQYVIWNRRIWNSGSGWSAYAGASPHTDHVHVSLSWDGATGRTSWWTGRTVTTPDFGPCQVYVGEAVPRYTAPRHTPCPPAVPRIQGAVSGDFDGDGRTEVGTFLDGRFSLRVGSSVRSFAFGSRGDLPVAGDWDGDGVDGIGVYRQGAWYLRDTLSTGAAQHSFRFGSAGDRPVVGSWDGRTVGIGVRNGQRWFLRGTASPGPAQHAFTWGSLGDVPVVGDWDRDGRDSVGVVRGSAWYLSGIPATSAPVRSLAFGGSAGWFPVPGDWDGDGATTPGSIRLGNLYLRDDQLGGAATRTEPVPF